MTSRRNILLLLALLICNNGFVMTTSASQEHELRAVRQTTTTTDTLETSSLSTQRRQLFNFWGLVFLADLVHCPPIGPAHEKCKNSHSGSSSGGSSSGSSSSSSYSESSAAESSSSESTKAGGNGLPEGTSRFQLWMFLVAAAAVAMAIAAIIVGQRRQEPKPHLLTGSVARRMGLFQAFCDSALCHNTSTTTNRPPGLEMTMSKDDYELHTNAPNSAALV